MEKLHSAEDRAGGLDGWRPAHWRLINEEAAHWLAQLFRLIEEGRPWPRGVLVAKAVLIRKPTTQWDQPLTFRIIAVLALLHRTWAVARLEDLGPWIQGWATPDMFAVAEGTDAALGALRSAVYRECATLKGKPFSGC